MMMEKIGRYKVIRPLGKGGMAQVYLAHDPDLDREVAIKVLPASFLEHQDLVLRFQREARTVARLEHRAIVPVYEFSQSEIGPYLVMRHMRGGSLAGRLTQGPLSLAKTARILSRLADPLDKAHQAGVVHRDLKPGNILFDEDGEAYLADFGIVKLADADQSLTITDGVIGTPAYMSPEQARGDRDIDGRSDVYALGVILYEMLTGDAPYHATTPLALALKHVLEPVPRLSNAVPALPTACDAIIQKAMAKDRADRYQTAQEMADDLLKVNDFIVDQSPPSKPVFQDTTTLRADRTLDVAMARQVIVGKATDLVAMVRRSSSPGLKVFVGIDQTLSSDENGVVSKMFAMEFPNERGAPQPGKLILRVNSPDFEPKRQEKIITVPPDGDSEVVAFLLTPQRAGELVLSVELYKDDTYIAARTLKTNGNSNGRAVAADGKTIASIPLFLTSNWPMADYRRALYELLAAHFNKDELRHLCFLLRVSAGDLGDGRANMARELILYLERRGRLPELVALIAKERPHLQNELAPFLSETPLSDEVKSPKAGTGPEERGSGKWWFSVPNWAWLFAGVLLVAFIALALSAGLRAQANGEGATATAEFLLAQNVTTTTETPAATVEPTSTATISPTMTPTARPSTTPLAVSASPLPPSPTMTVSPAPTPIQTSTATATVTPTTTAASVQLRTIATNVRVRTGPSEENPTLSLLNSGVVVEVLGKVRGGWWYEIKTDGNVTGWVDGDLVQFIAGSDADVPITWPSLTATSPPETDTPPSLCSAVEVVHGQNGDVRLLWTGYPVGTDHLRLTVSGTADGNPLIYPNDIDQTDPDWAKNGFTIGSWLFGQRGFADNTTFTYVMQALDGAGGELCAVSGRFTK